MTRAKQILIISGSDSEKNSVNNWHRDVCSALDIKADESYIQSYGEAEQPSHATPQAELAPHEYDVRLFQALPNKRVQERSLNTASQQKQEAEQYLAAQQASNDGVIVHKILELLSLHEYDDQTLLNRIQIETQLKPSPSSFKALKEQAKKCMTDDRIAKVFEIDSTQQALNEYSIAHNG